MADDATDSMHTPAAVTVYREAARLLISAVVLAKDAAWQGAPLDLQSGARRLEEFVQSGALPALPECYGEAMAILDEPDLMALDQLAPEKMAERRVLVETLVRWLRNQIEPRSLRAIWVARVVRIALAAAAVLGLVVWGLVSVLAPKNVALHKPVTMSSRPPTGPNPAGATDGKVVSPFQAHTAIESDPWITVDLGTVFNISEVKIYNRTDGLFDGALPLTLEFSDNSTDYHAVDLRTEAFTGSEPWVFRTHAAHARFVRIHGHPGGYVVVTEIEVYGK